MVERYVLDRKSMARILLKKIGMDPNLIDELESKFSIGSGLFLIELCANSWNAGKLENLVGAMSLWSKATTNIGEPILMRDPWNHQKLALDAWVDAGYMGILEMATGTGKTLVALSAIDWLYKNEWSESSDFKVIILSHSLALLSQWRRMAIEDLGLPADVNMPYNVPVMTDKIQIEFMSIQSVMKNPDDFDCDFLIVDEVHHSAAPEFRKALTLNATCKMGLSATVEGEQRYEQLKPMLGDIVYSYPLKKAIEDGVLPDFDWKLYPIELSISEQEEFKIISKSIVEKFNIIRGDSISLRELTEGKIARLHDLGDFFKALEIARYKKKEIPETWKVLQILVLKRRWIIHKSQPKLMSALKLTEQWAQSKKCVAFTMDIQSANDFANMLLDKGINVYPIHSQIPDQERWRRIQSFKSAKTGVLVAPKVLDEGIDIPDAEIGINIASSKTRLQLVQRIGRIIRKQPGKRPQFHHFVGVPSPELQMVSEDGLDFLDDVSWVQDTAMKMGVVAETQPDGITGEMNRARLSAEDYLSKRLREEERIELPSYGSLNLSAIVNGIPTDMRRDLSKRLIEMEGHIIQLSDKAWSVLVRKSYAASHPEYSKIGIEKPIPIDISGHIWILLAGEREPKKIAALLVGK
jgi:superfamily II DNA or RNA helicase